MILLKNKLARPLNALVGLCSTLFYVTPAFAATSPYFGNYEIISSQCIENGRATGRAKAAVGFDFEDSAVGRVFREIDNADGVKGQATYYFDGGRSPFGAGEYTLEENAQHFSASAHRRIDGKAWIEKTESFEIIPATDSFTIKVTRIQQSNYTRNNSILCEFKTTKQN